MIGIWNAIKIKRIKKSKLNLPSIFIDGKFEQNFYGNCLCKLFGDNTLKPTGEVTGSIPVHMTIIILTLKSSITSLKYFQ